MVVLAATLDNDGRFAWKKVGMNGSAREIKRVAKRNEILYSRRQRRYAEEKAINRSIVLPGDNSEEKRTKEAPVVIIGFMELRTRSAARG